MTDSMGWGKTCWTAHIMSTSVRSAPIRASSMKSDSGTAGQRDSYSQFGDGGGGGPMQTGAKNKKAVRINQVSN